MQQYKSHTTGHFRIRACLNHFFSLPVLQEAAQNVKERTQDAVEGARDAVRWVAKAPMGSLVRRRMARHGARIRYPIIHALLLHTARSVQTHVLSSP